MRSVIVTSTSLSQENGLWEDSRFLGSQILTVDRAYIWSVVWKLEAKYYQEVRKALNMALDLKDDLLE